MRALFLCLAAAVPFFGQMNIVAFSGSTRSDSYNKKLIQEAAMMARKMGAKVTVIDLKYFPIPFYDGDLEAKQGLPEAVKKLRKLLLKSDGVIIASPEYNGSLSAVLKNTIDWLSRGEEGGTNYDVFTGRKFAVMSASPGRGGGVRSLAHLEKILGDLGAKVLETQVAVPEAYNQFNEQGALSNETYKTKLHEEMEQLVQF